MSRKHSLSAKDKTALIADCSVCGPGAKIARNGRYGYACVVGRREAKKRWAQAHPERARENRKYRPSAHRLSVKNGGPDSCSKCGSVSVIVWGRGYMCANLAKERRVTSTQLEPAPKCKRCDRAWLVDGECPRCTPGVAYRELPQWMTDDLAAAGMHVEVQQAWLPDDRENAVPGWKTLGSATAEPPKVRPEYAALYGSGRS